MMMGCKAMNELTSKGSLLFKEGATHPSPTKTITAIAAIMKHRNDSSSAFAKLECCLRDKRYGFGTELFNLIEVRLSLTFRCDIDASSPFSYLLWCILECKGFRHFSFDILVGEWHILHHS
jgi:hypothetical protein